MKNQQIIAIYEKLLNLVQNIDTHFSAKISFAIVRNLKSLEPIVEDIMSTRMKIIEQYGEPVPGSPGNYQPKLGNTDILNKELAELGNIETSVIIHKISINDLKDYNLSLQDIDALYFMISEEN